MLKPDELRMRKFQGDNLTLKQEMVNKALDDAADTIDAIVDDYIEIYNEYNRIGAISGGTWWRSIYDMRKDLHDVRPYIISIKEDIENKKKIDDALSILIKNGYNVSK